jgi:uncharacterized low-complexity protein
MKKNYVLPVQYLQYGTDLARSASVELGVCIGRRVGRDLAYTHSFHTRVRVHVHVARAFEKHARQSCAEFPLRTNMTTNSSVLTSHMYCLGHRRPTNVHSDPNRNDSQLSTVLGDFLWSHYLTSVQRRANMKAAIVILSLLALALMSPAAATIRGSSHLSTDAGSSHNEVNHRSLAKGKIGKKPTMKPVKPPACMGKGKCGKKPTKSPTKAPTAAPTELPSTSPPSPASTA